MVIICQNLFRTPSSTENSSLNEVLNQSNELNNNVNKDESKSLGNKITDGYYTTNSNVALEKVYQVKFDGETLWKMHAKLKYGEVKYGYLISIPVFKRIFEYSNIFLQILIFVFDSWQFSKPNIIRIFKYFCTNISEYWSLKIT